MQISLLNEKIFINQTEINTKNQLTEILLSIQDFNIRNFELENKSTLIINDSSGMRFWKTQSGLVSELQIFTEVKTMNELFPSHIFSGKIYIDEEEIILPLSKSKLITFKNLNLSIDNDSLKYKLNILNHKSQGLTYSFFINNSTSNIGYISIRFNN